jgi:hypothetical protein
MSSDEARRRLEMEATLKQIKTIQKRQANNRKRVWRLDVSIPKLTVQGLGVFALGVLVGMGLFVLVWVAFN